MKYILILILIISLPVAEANILEDTTNFFKNYFSLTGQVISKITQTFTDEANPKLDLTTQEVSELKKSCEDSDSIDYNKKGYCKSKLRTFNDFCSKDNQMVMEFTCNEANECVKSWYLCEGRCFDGACVDVVKIAVN
ncbi:hypothetical protein J4438_00285 [Candidatus Woesearchaeota archaeon]|nr:hypothetical protein [Candidatus Woesearchaeota archaeon]